MLYLYLILHIILFYTYNSTIAKFIILLHGFSTKLFDYFSYTQNCFCNLNSKYECIIVVD